MIDIFAIIIMPPKTIYLIRHAESEFNLARDQGLSYDGKDPDLTVKGEDQARQLGKDLTDVQFDLVLISTLKRAERTAELMKLKSKLSMAGDLYREYRTDPCDFFEDEEIVIETLEELQSRVQLIKAYLRNHCEGNVIAVVSHADLIWHLTAENHEGETYGEWLANADYTIITI